MERPMKALSIKQPWAWLICKGIKDVENRTWWIHMPPLLNYPATPRRIYVHASKTPEYKALPEVERIMLGNNVPPDVVLLNGNMFCPTNDFLDKVIGPMARREPNTIHTLGAIIGEVDIVGCKYRFGEERDALYSPWHKVGMYGLLLASAELYDNPIPCKGKLGFFVPDFRRV